ncbi:MAG: thiolase domain-containing protein, partial [Candidatus Heimdallarchaeota archaeon]|nr:thiolase domain-containing protein [Candidatus Heimdallarchaeota archaeon]MCK5048839.1 thiolase domain-containing protein [Candidatus Heimdallarchaeota archaeon]
MKKVTILGTGMTTFTDLYDYDLNEMTDLALTRAYGEVEAKNIDGLFVGSMASGQFLNQANLGAYVASSANLNCPTLHIGAGSASGAAAVRAAYFAILSGIHDVVAVVGVEKMTDSIIGPEQMKTISSGLDHKWTVGMGGTIPAMYAMVAKAHMKEYGTTSEQMANVALKNHFHGSHNPKAQFQREIRLQTVLGSKLIADPLRLFNGPAASDGAAAIILASEEYASKVTDEPVYIAGSGVGMDTLSLAGRSSLTSFEATKQASKQAYEMAGS